jgi:hypothetical protein
VLVNNIAENKETKPTAKNNKTDLNQFCFIKNLIYFKKIGKKNVKDVNIKKSSNLTETYVPGIRNKGNFGYRGIVIKIAVIKNL